ncbi:MAG TPA: hypothetical protein VE084_07695 [Burkholderiaceae bacterium]|nr:hypothetical protein [Burkholderiaceae bacterium]
MLLILLSATLVFVAACLWLVFGWTGEAPQDRQVREAIDTSMQTLGMPLRRRRRG